MICIQAVYYYRRLNPNSKHSLTSIWQNGKHWINLFCFLFYPSLFPFPCLFLLLFLPSHLPSFLLVQGNLLLNCHSVSFNFMPNLYPSTFPWYQKESFCLKLKKYKEGIDRQMNKVDCNTYGWPRYKLLKSLSEDSQIHICIYLSDDPSPSDLQYFLPFLYWGIILTVKMPTF